MIYIQQEIDSFTYSNITSSVLPWNNDILTAGAFIVGQTYTIVTVGTTDFTLIGAASNTIGVSFTATGIGVGTGTAQTVYLLNDLVRVGNYHYKSTYGTLSLPNSGNAPLENLGTAWFEYEASNIYAMLDEYSETRTEWPVDGVVEFERGDKNTLGIGNFTADTVTIEYLDALGVLVGDPVVYYYSTNIYVFDEWDYGYADFSPSVNQIIYLPLLRRGVTVRVTFSRSTNPTNCGFMLAGKAQDMGSTLDQVNFPDKRIGSRTLSVADFDTIVASKDLVRKISDSKKLVDVPMLFIIDPRTSSVHQNLVILGRITQCSGQASTSEKNRISWQVEQNILT